MGLDLYLEVEDCKHCGRDAHTESFHCTYNLTPMWQAIWKKDDKLIDIDGYKGKEAAVKLGAALVMMEDKHEELKKLNPPNGFGSYDGLYELLKCLLVASQKYPEGTWVSWR